MKIIDQYEVNIYGVLVVLFLVFAIGYTVLIVRQQQIISQMASAKEKAQFGPTILTDTITLNAKIEPLCGDQVFSVDSRQANSADLRTLIASVTSNQGNLEIEIDRNTNNVNADTEFIIRGQNYLAKKKSLGDANDLDFGNLIPGDVTGDGKITQKDSELLSQKIKTTRIDTKFDLNCDGKVDTSDLEIINASLGKIAD